MPAMIEVQIDKGDMARAKALLAAIPNGYKKAATRAINETATHVRSVAVKRISKAIGLQQKLVREEVSLRKASYSRQEAHIVILGKPRALILFKARQVKKGVRFSQGERGRKVVHSAFIATMPSGHQGVFKRAGGSRLPIEELFGPSVLTGYRNTPGVIETVERDSAGMLEKALLRNIDVLLAKHARKA